MEDNTNQTPQTQPVQAPSEPTVPVSPLAEETKKGGSGMWLIIIVLVVVLLGAGGFYFYSTMNRQAPAVNDDVTQAVQQELNSLQNELNAADVGDIEGDFTQIDRDLADL